MGLGILEDHKLQHVPGQLVSAVLNKIPCLLNSGILVAMIANFKSKLHLQRTIGTAILEESEQDYNNVQIHKHLKYDTSGPVPIVLIPQPSDDPNDPLVYKEKSLVAQQSQTLSIQ